jgi:hypothetical protein
VDLLGDLLIRPTPAEIVADQAAHPGKRGLMVRRPTEADGAQLGEVCVVGGIGGRDRSAGNQGSASHDRDGQDGQPAG